jgi:hypothetical protein
MSFPHRAAVEITDFVTDGQQFRRAVLVLSHLCSSKLPHSPSSLEDEESFEVVDRVRL